MPDMHLKQPGFTYCACAPFTKNKGRIEKFMQTGNTDFFIKMNLIRLVFNMIWKSKRFNKNNTIRKSFKR